VSESRDDGQHEHGGQPEGAGQPGSSKAQPGNDKGQPRSNQGQPRSDRGQPGNNQGQPRSDSGQPRTNGWSGGGSQSRRPSDPIGDFQRWLMRAGARSMANQVAGQVKRTLGQERREYGDVWDTATNETPPGEPPECQWCPICQAARAARVSGPGLGARLADAGGVVATVLQDAFSAFEQVMKEQNRSPERKVVPPPSPVTPSSSTPSSKPPEPPAPAPPPSPPAAEPDQEDGGQ
jgi:hypothetical protein